MYKVIYENIIIDVLEEVKYVKYIPTTGRVYPASKPFANCIIASNGKDRYHIKGSPYPEGSFLKSVVVFPMTLAEEAQYKNEQKSDPATAAGIRAVKSAKLSELSKECNSQLVRGIDVILSDKETHHFDMTVEDQLNLLEILYLYNMGETSFIFHESGGEYKEYSREDMMTIITTWGKYKQWHLKHHNALKKYVNSLDNISNISEVTYGMKLEGSAQS